MTLCGWWHLEILVVKECVVVSSLGFLSVSHVLDLELKRIATWKYNCWVVNKQKNKKQPKPVLFSQQTKKRGRLGKKKS